jgi:hypothetical protein
MTAIVLLVTLALGFLVAPLAAEAQQPAKIRRIGFLAPGWFALHTELVASFRHRRTPAH